MSSATRRETASTKPKPKPCAKPIVKVDSPFTAPTWPKLESGDRDIILKLLDNLLEPIGQHKIAHTTPSKGKRSKKRKRSSPSREETLKPQNPAPPQPEITKYITLGLNSTFRHLHDTKIPSQSQAKDKVPGETISTDQTQAKGESSRQPGPSDNAIQEPPKATTRTHLTAIFLTHCSPSQHVPYTPLPLLAYLASTAHPSSPATRLVPLSSTSEALLCKTLGIPRVGIIGLFEGAPGASALVEYVREKVEVTDVPWVHDFGDGNWLGTNIMFGEEDSQKQGK